jgi:hypothetical protein
MTATEIRELKRALTAKEIRETKALQLLNRDWVREIALQLAENRESKYIEKGGNYTNQQVADAVANVQRLIKLKKKVKDQDAEIWALRQEGWRKQEELEECKDNYGVMSETISRALQTIQDRNKRIEELEAEVQGQAADKLVREIDANAEKGYTGKG